MKMILILGIFISLSSFAQDPKAYLSAFDNKIYSLKSKGVKDFVVDIESSKLTRQMNDQMIFGKVEDLIFRTYWTANPERIAIDVIGLPEGFKEVKEELKLAILTVIENLLPPTTAQKFAGYNFSATSNPKEFLAQDSSGIASIPSFLLKFNKDDSLSEIIGKKPIGSLVIELHYEKKSFSEGKLALETTVSTSTDNGQTLVTSKDLDYDEHQGVGVLSKVKIKTEQKSTQPSAKSMISEETMYFKNYKINTGEALKFFLGESSKTVP